MTPFFQKMIDVVAVAGYVTNDNHLTMERLMW
jgi:hypothetical protein